MRAKCVNGTAARHPIRCPDSACRRRANLCGPASHSRVRRLGRQRPSGHGSGFRPLGNGDDADHNLYWGSAYGVRTFFSQISDWKLVCGKIISRPASLSAASSGTAPKRFTSSLIPSVAGRSSRPFWTSSMPLPRRVELPHSSPSSSGLCFERYRLAIEYLFLQVVRLEFSDTV